METADEIARLCFAYQENGYSAQVEKHLKILKDHSKGRPGSRMENSQRHMVVKVKIALIEAKSHLVSKKSNLASQVWMKNHHFYVIFNFWNLFLD